MAYDSDFYTQYAKYLLEPRVRQCHDMAIKMARALFRSDLDYVIDLGCGEHREFLKYGSPRCYCGVDTVAESCDVQKDYRTLDYTQERFQPYTSFVSLFSTEITAPAFKNYDLYTRIFREMSRCRVGVVSGFYYYSKQHENPVVETGDIVSYQTLDLMGSCPYPIESFEEIQVTMHVPSQMFGLDVYEVWKFFRRKE